VKPLSWEDARAPAPIPPAPDGAATPLPSGFGLRRDPGTRLLDGGLVIMGGSPLRLLRTSLRGSALVRSWESGTTVGARRGPQMLARRLVASGAFLPLPGPPTLTSDAVTVVIPVRDRPEQLQRLLTALRPLDCLVVDDGSSDPARTREIAEGAGAKVLSLPTNRGPAAARNAGLAQVGSPLVAFVDSDCVPNEGWLAPLLGHFDDPLVVAVAPRIVPIPAVSGGALSAYEAVRSSLDRGASAGLVRPMSRIPYVPSATLVVRRQAVPDELFDSRLRGGEDVDMVWRLVDAGWDVRYEPASVVQHEGPQTLGSWVRRRAFYGTSAGPLARRHPGSLAPLHTSVWTAAVWILVLARRPLPAAGALAVSVAVLARRLRGLVDEPVTVAAQIAGAGTAKSSLPALHGLTRAWAPAFVLGLCWRRTRRAAAVALLAPALGDWATTRRVLDPVRFCALHVADDLAYGGGVWWGCLRAQTLVPLVPRVALRARTWSNPSLRRQLRATKEP
jgi:mycofactocin glycosyltransferase